MEATAQNTQGTSIDSGVRAAWQVVKVREGEAKPTLPMPGIANGFQ